MHTILKIVGTNIKNKNLLDSSRVYSPTPTNYSNHGIRILCTLPPLLPSKPASSD